MSFWFPSTAMFQPSAASSAPPKVDGSSGGGAKVGASSSMSPVEDVAVASQQQQLSQAQENQPRLRNKPLLVGRRSQMAFLSCCVLALYSGLTIPVDMRMIRYLRSTPRFGQFVPISSSAEQQQQRRAVSTKEFWNGRDNTNDSLKIAWLMSFPNSGTSFTIKHIRYLGMTQTATNYGHENTQLSSGEAVPVFSDQPGGPFWMDPDVHPELAFPSRLVLVKTHCGGRCETCPPQRYFESTYSFRQQCLTGKSRHFINGQRIDEKVSYPADRVAKAIHLIRDPFDNVVSRFHMETKGNRSAIDYDVDREGFRQYCFWLNDQYKEDEKKARILYHSKLLIVMKDVPCRADFFRYVEWHNQAFALTQDLGLETLVVHYDEYTSDMKGVSKRLLQFLDLSARGTPYAFEPGKEYRNEYFTARERRAVHQAFQFMASLQTWTHIKQYFADETPADEVELAIP
ncbi:hypothetical protein ACA910_020500 [Epithemia clementina (nom. ined.)]